MKKIIAMLLAVTMLLALCACGGNKGTDAGTDAGTAAGPQGEVDDLLAKTVDGAVDPEMVLVTAEATEENFSWYFFTEYIPGCTAWVSEPMNGSIPHFVGMIRVPGDADPQAAADDIKANLDPRKWICVEAEKTAVVLRGDLILVVMSDSSTVDKVVENFNAL